MRQLRHDSSSPWKMTSSRDTANTMRRVPLNARAVPSGDAAAKQRTPPRAARRPAGQHAREPSASEARGSQTSKSRVGASLDERQVIPGSHLSAFFAENQSESNFGGKIDPENQISSQENAKELKPHNPTQKQDRQNSSDVYSAK
ncbi:hypothetical protein FGIG_05957 [Fasciola gigantica]|uniref:Uncharacterized protein n=1 Tax=Fasciola gigantica TaxID=46835 RepID=A0A504Z403_FASGI|nr:hypothetical protein FGIG_05957 [Fasciola gigantica]